MTTTIMPPPAASALRILPIAANLLPSEIVESRHGRRLRRTVLAALAGAVALLVAWYGLAVFQTSGARAGLVSAQEDTQSLTQRQKSYTDLVDTQTRSQAVAAELSSLLAGDLRWSRLLGALRGAAPTGVTVTGVTGTLASASNGTGAGAAQLPNASVEKPVGTLTVNGTGPTRAAVAAFVDALARVPGLANPLVGSASMEGNLVQFSVRLDITKSSLGGRFTSPGPSASAAK
jgi:Tfp pilus assembly protein PilN